MANGGNLAKLHMVRENVTPQCLEIADLRRGSKSREYEDVQLCSDNAAPERRLRAEAA